tara:strand:- start:5090 stop:5407 length:318 start_codon:yes stop_codon:yes gene_type:complete
MIKILITFVLLIMLSACQSVKDGLSGTKQNNSDEFLVQKKSPLAVPPDFENLPEPGGEKEKEDEEIKNQKLNIKDLITSSSSTLEEKESKSQSIEKFILNKIKKN